MANLNGKGPREEGPKTGRGLGHCAGGRGTGAGFGPCCSRGRGYGRGFGVYHQPTKSEEIADAKAYLENLKAELKAVEDYLKELDSEE